MKNFLWVMFAGMSIISCRGFYDQHDSDIYYHLSDAQLTFINTPKTGDTCIWESSLGLRDTGIVQPVVIGKFTIHSQHNGSTYGEKASYLYKFVGNKKTYVADLVTLTSNSPNLGLNLWVDTFPYNYGMSGMIPYKKIGNQYYVNVYYCLYYLQTRTNVSTDSAFCNSTGFLGYKTANEIVVKIR